MPQMLHAKPAAVHKTPDAPGLQEELGQVKRIAAGLPHLGGCQEGLRMGLDSPNQDLGLSLSLEVLRKGKADVIERLLKDVLLGQPG